MEESHTSGVQETFSHKLQRIIEGVESFAEHTSEKINRKIEHFREKSRVFDLIVDIIVVNVANYEVLRALVEVFHLSLRATAALLHSYDVLGKMLPI